MRRQQSRASFLDIDVLVKSSAVARPILIHVDPQQLRPIKRGDTVLLPSPKGQHLCGQGGTQVLFEVSLRSISIF